MSLARFFNKPIYPLTDISGLVAWRDYLPVKEQAAPGRADSFDNDGYMTVSEVLASISGKVAWVDYTPVYVDDTATIPWSTDVGGFIPVSDSGGDPDFDSVVSLLHFDGTDAGTTFTDVTGLVWTGAGNAQLDTDQKKFGTASLLLDGTGDYLESPDNDTWSLGTSDFTIECWVRHGADPTLNARWLSKWTEAGNQREWAFGPLATGNLRFSYSTTGADSVTRDKAWTPVANTWHHVCAMRVGTTLYMFQDGVSLGTATIADMFVGSSVCRIGNGVDSGVAFNGWMDEIRITKGVARYDTGGFTPPAAPFPDE